MDYQRNDRDIVKELVGLVDAASKAGDHNGNVALIRALYSRMLEPDMVNYIRRRPSFMGTVVSKAYSFSEKRPEFEAVALQCAEEFLEGGARKTK